VPRQSDISVKHGLNVFCLYVNRCMVVQVLVRGFRGWVMT